jgi:hypothetical protein
MCVRYISTFDNRMPLPFNPLCQFGFPAASIEYTYDNDITHADTYLALLMDISVFCS